MYVITIHQRYRRGRAFHYNYIIFTLCGRCISASYRTDRATA